MNKRKLSYEARIQELKKFLAQEDYQNCVPSRLRIYNQIIGLCFPPGWTSITLFNYYTADKELIPAVEAIINDKDIPNNDKLYAFEKYVEYLAGKDRHVDAENVAKRCIALFENNPKSLARAYGFLAKAYRYQDRYDDGLKAAREAMKYDKMAGIFIASDLAKAFDKRGDIKTFWKDANVYDKLMYFVNNGIVDSETRNIAYNFAMNEENNIRHRLEIAERYFIGNSEQARTVREKLKGNGKLLNTGIWSHPINNNYRLGGFEMVNDLAGFYAGSSIMNDIHTKRLQVISLGASNREADGAKLAAEFAKDEKISEVDRMRFKFYEAILSGKSTDNLMKNTSLSRKEQSQVYLSAARHCLLWQKSDLAEKYSKIYSSPCS